MPFLFTLGTMGSHLSGQSWVTFKGNAASAAHELLKVDTVWLACPDTTCKQEVYWHLFNFKKLNTENLNHSLFLFLAKQPYVIALFKNFIYLDKKWWHCILWHIACIFSQQYNRLQTYYVKCFFIPACTVVVGLFWSKPFPPAALPIFPYNVGHCAIFFSCLKLEVKLRNRPKQMYFSSLK